MILFTRADTSMFGRWWWTVDRWLLASLGLLILCGVLLVSTASPAVADRIGLSSSYFIVRHLLMLLPALAIMIGVSMLSPRQVQALAALVFVMGIMGLILTLFIGVEIKGARRWIHLPGFSLQPSEFVKPAFIVLNALLLAHPAVRTGLSAKLLPLGLYFLVAGLLILQPDFGMTVIVTGCWIAQLFIAGLPVYIFVALGLIFVCGLFGAYLALPHVTSRIDRFLDPSSGDTYQVDRAREAFHNGGLMGVGLGQGSIKDQIPDAHADFIFPVAAEELGLIVCLLLLGLIAFIILRGLYRSGQGPTLFVSLAGAGLVIQFAGQAFVNIGSSLQLLPAKGMTLPFISYGGSSLLAMALGMGMLLALTRRRTHAP